MQTQLIKNFVDKLAGAPSMENVTNQYDYSKSSNEIRRKNLVTYLNIYSKNNSNTLLVGEAPGYKGALYTGVPFTSEEIITKYEFFQSPDFSIEDNKKLPQKEKSATIVWSAFDNLKFYPLAWNVFPFHPHKSDMKGISNRTPEAGEVEDFGKNFLLSLIEIFQIKYFIASGRKAEKILNDFNKNPEYIKHPSRSGVKSFSNGLRKLLKNDIRPKTFDL